MQFHRFIWIISNCTINLRKAFLPYSRFPDVDSLMERFPTGNVIVLQLGSSDLYFLALFAVKSELQMCHLLPVRSGILPYG